MLRIDLCALDLIYQPDVSLPRPTMIQQRKQAIYAYRNQCLSQLSGQRIEQDSFANTLHGKPYLKNQVLAFNHSHSQQHYALVSSVQHAHVGVDVEDLNRRVRMDALAQHAFHPEEYATWKALDEDRHYWFKVWTTKEAVLKAHGLGIRLSLNELNTQVHPTQDTGQIEHVLLGKVAYQNFVLNQVMLTVAWCLGEGKTESEWPQIELFQH